MTMQHDTSDGWSRELSHELGRAHDEGDIIRFEEILRDHPRQCFSRNGSNYWMHSLAWQGELEWLKVLLKLGLDINLPKAPPSDEHHEPEGAIHAAAANGHTELVKWMLDLGARINFVSKGQRRCMPLVSAATQGHLDVVKLLVEYGADIHATWRGPNRSSIPVNAITQAALFGKRDVYDYLYSLGARDLRETEPPNFADAHDRIRRQMTGERGPLSNWTWNISKDPLVTLHFIPANAKCDVHTLFTVGLSDRRLPTNDQPFATTELHVMLPASWKVSDEAIDEPQWNWPFLWIKKIVRQSIEAQIWPDDPVLFMNADPPQPLSESTKLCGWFCLKLLGEDVNPIDARVIDFHSMFPIYEGEAEFIREHGSQSLVRRFDHHNVPLAIDAHRPNMADPKYALE